MFETYSKFTNSLVDMVNSSRGLNRRTRNALVPSEVRKAFKDGAKLAVELGLVIDTVSEMSARLSGGKVLATTAEALFTRMGDLHTGFFSLISDTSLEQKAPPCHMDWHQALYAIEDINWVLYCHSPAILKAANSKTLPDPGVLVDAAELLQAVDFTDPEAGAIASASEKASMLLIPQHGLLSWGADVYEAIVKAEIIAWVFEAM
jgi:ribulose-5-phosphate 4-epimerase/fuculose-1-phosphate aldolase